MSSLLKKFGYSSHSSSKSSATQPAPVPSAALTSLITKFQHASILSTTQFTRADLDALMAYASHMAHLVLTRGTCSLLADRLLGVIFYEPSTRTSGSFQAAMLRLGGKVQAILDVSSSSVAKGETIEDTVRCWECYVDAIVMRHPQQGSLERAARAASIPMLNAGDGVGEHPTQALLDLYTLQQEAGRVDGLTVTMVGDLLNGRTVHSLAKLLMQFTGVTINYVSPPSLAMPADIQQYIREHSSVTQHSTADLASVLAATDVLYVTRVQKERFADMAHYEQTAAAYQITPELLGGAKDTLRVMHPLPRVTEIDVRVDEDVERAAYFRQMRYGLYVRMALLAVVFGRRPEDEAEVVARVTGH